MLTIESLHGLSLADEGRGPKNGQSVVSIHRLFGTEQIFRIEANIKT